MIFSLVVAFAWTAEIANAAVLRVDVENLRNDQGVVYCELFDKADGFPGKPERALARIKAEIKRKSAVCEFDSVSRGTYAVAAFHDEKRTGKLQRNLLGIPKEGVGFSNDVSGRWERPSFEHAKFEMSDEDQQIALHLHYPR